jgi:hypothetical protein
MKTEWIQQINVKKELVLWKDKQNWLAKLNKKERRPKLTKLEINGILQQKTLKFWGSLGKIFKTLLKSRMKQKCSLSPL